MSKINKIKLFSIFHMKLKKSDSVHPWILFGYDNVNYYFIQGTSIKIDAKTFQLTNYFENETFYVLRDYHDNNYLKNITAFQLMNFSHLSKEDFYRKLTKTSKDVNGNQIPNCYSRGWVGRKEVKVILKKLKACLVEGEGFENYNFDKQWKPKIGDKKRNDDQLKKLLQGKNLTKDSVNAILENSSNNLNKILFHIVMAKKPTSKIFITKILDII